MVACGGGGRALVVVLLVDDEALHDLIGEVYVGQDGVGVGAGQLQATEVRPAAEKHVQGGASDICGIGVLGVVAAQELQQFDEVGRCAVHGCALFAGAVVGAAEQQLQVDRDVLLIGDALERGHARCPGLLAIDDGEAGAADGLPRGHEGVLVADAGVDGVGIDLLGSGLPAEGLAISLEKGGLRHLGHVERRGQIGLHQHRHRLRHRANGLHALEDLQLTHNGGVLPAGDVFERGWAPQRGIDGNGADIEVGLIVQKGRHAGADCGVRDRDLCRLHHALQHGAGFQREKLVVESGGDRHRFSVHQRGQLLDVVVQRHVAKAGDTGRGRQGLHHRDVVARPICQGVGQSHRGKRVASQFALQVCQSYRDVALGCPHFCRDRTSFIFAGKNLCQGLDSSI